MATACLVHWNGTESGLSMWILCDNVVFPIDWHFLFK